MVPIDTPPPSASSPSLETRLHTLLGQAGVPTLDELLQFLMRELAETSAPVEHAELSVRIALLLADGRNQLDAAAELTAEVVHPVASALRLHAAIDRAAIGGGSQAQEPLLTLAAGLTGRSDEGARSEIGELLLWRGAYDAAASLLSSTSSLRLLALALWLAGREREAEAELAKSSDAADLLWAGMLHEPKASAPQSETLQQQALYERSMAGIADPQTLAGMTERARATEAVLRVPGLPLSRRTAYVRALLAMMGGIETLTAEQSTEAALRRVVPATVALRLSFLLAEEQSTRASQEAARLAAAVARFCATHPAAAGHVAQTLAMFVSARSLEQAGDALAAAQQWSALGHRAVELSEPLPGVSDAGPTYQELAVRAMALAFLHRAGELYQGLLGTDRNQLSTALEVYERLSALGVTDEVTTLLRARLLLLGDAAQLPALLAGCALSVAEGISDRERHLFALRALRASEALQLEPPDLSSVLGVGAERAALEVLARYHRRRSHHTELVETYRRIAAIEFGSGGAAYSCVAAAVALCFMQEPSTDGPTQVGAPETRVVSLQQEAERFVGQPGGVLALATRVLMLQRLSRYAELTPALQALIAATRSTDTQTNLYRQLGNHAAEHISDFGLAEDSYNQVLQRRAGDVVALHALARLVQHHGEPLRAVQLLEQAVESALTLSAPVEAVAGGTPSTLGMLQPRYGLGSDSRAPVGAQAAALLACELGALYEQLAGSGHADALNRAVACYEEALRKDPRCRPAARALVSLYRSQQRTAELMSAMAKLLPLLRDDQQRLGLLLEMGELEQQRAQLHPEVAEHATERAIDAYAEALALDAAHEAAIMHLSHLCRATGRWGLLAETLERAPHTLSVVQTLREAYENLAQAAEQARIREEELTLLTDVGEQITCAKALAELYQRLERPDDEVRVWERLYDLAPEELWHDANVLLALERRYGQSGRYADQANLITRALSHLQQKQEQHPESDELREQRRALLLRLGDVQRDFLAAPAQATATFELVTREWPQDHAALAALAGLYAQQERGDDLRRTLARLLETTHEPVERSKLLFQLGELTEKQGDQSEAYKLIGQAFYLDPANRLAFTAYERLCYRREQWQEALRMYEAALRLIETQKSRSYRPADLHLRRGQVQLQYLQQLDDAVISYTRALESDAENDTTQATLERIYASRNQWKELLSAYERRAQLVRDDGKRVEILRRGARVATAKLRDVAEAVRFFEKLHAVDPTDSEALDSLEVHYDRIRDYEKLIGLLSTRVALSLDEQQIIALNMRIGLLCEEGLRDHDRAITAYRHVVEQQPTHREALDAMARLFEANERWAELIDVTRKQIRLVTDRAQKALLYFKCGSVTEAKFGKEDEAIRYYEAAVRSSAACLPALHSLRDIYIRREDWTRVTQTLELEAKLWTEDKERAGILAHIGQLYLDKLKNADRAIQYYENALAVDKECLPANRALFQIYFQREDWQRAFAAGQVLLAKANREGEPSERSAFQSRRAIVAQRLGNLRVACESVVTALEIWPENISALETLAVLCRARNSGYDFAPICRELDKQYRRRSLHRCLSLLLIAQASLAERSADVDAADALLTEAVKLSPDDFLPVEAQAMLHERLRNFALSRSVIEAFIKHCHDSSEPLALLPQLVMAQLRLAELYSESMMDADKAVVALRAVCAEEARAGGQSTVPGSVWRSARYRLSQELFRLGRFSDARGEIEGLIELATQPLPHTTSPRQELRAGESSGAGGAPPVELARYFDYLGRILDAQGDAAAAQRTFRRAVDLDPTFALPVLALAKRAAQGGDRGQAELLMRDALTQLEQKRGLDVQAAYQAELLLRRGIAYLLAGIDPAQAAQAYRQVIELCTRHVGTEAPGNLGLSETGQPITLVAWETLDDRIALADLLLHQLRDPRQSIVELAPVLQRDLRQAPAYPLLSEAYAVQGLLPQAERVLALESLLGYGQRGKTGGAGTRKRRTLSAELRQQWLLPKALVQSQLLELVGALREGLQRLFPTPWPLPIETQPASRVADERFLKTLAEMTQLFDTAVDVHFAKDLHGYVLSLEAPAPGQRPVVVLDLTALSRSEAEQRYLLGRALEPVRGGYAPLLRLTESETERLVRLLLSLTTNPGHLDPAAQEFLLQLSESSQQAVLGVLGQLQTQAQATAAAANQSASTSEPRALLSIHEFLQVLPLCADRAGLVAADDIAATIRTMARAQGEELEQVEADTGTHVDSGASESAGQDLAEDWLTLAKGPESQVAASAVGKKGASGILLGQVTGGAELARYYLSSSYHELTAALDAD